MGLWHRYSWVAYLAVFVGVLGHSSTEFVAVLSGMAGPELSVWRFVLGGAGLVVLALIFSDSRDLITPIKEQGVRLVLLSVLGVTIAYLFFHWSLDFASVVQVATLVTTIPIFVGISNLLVNKEPITLSKVLSAICAFLGIILLITDGYLADLAGSAKNLVGIVMAVFCAAAVAAYSVLIKPVVAEYGALRVTAITMFLGSLGLWVVVGLFFGVWVFPQRLAALDMNAVVALGVIAFFNTTVTQLLWIGGLAAVPDITRGSYLFFLKPAIAALLAVLVLGQELTLTQVVAIVVITASVFSEMIAVRLSKCKA